MYSWSFLHRVAEQFRENSRIQQDLLVAVGLQDYGFVDCDLSDLLLSIPADAAFETSLMQVIERVLEEITLAADQERASTWPNMEVLSNQHPEIAKGLDHIIEIRDAEIQQTGLPHSITVI